MSPRSLILGLYGVAGVDGAGGSVRYTTLDSQGTTNSTDRRDCLCVLDCNRPVNALWLTNCFRRSGEVTLDNWRNHRALHDAAAFADVVDQNPTDFAVNTRRFRCADTNLVRFKLLKTDPEGRLRCYMEGMEGSYGAMVEPVAWYYDLRGFLRFVWDHGNDQRTFLDPAGKPLWSWRQQARECCKVTVGVVGEGRSPNGLPPTPQLTIRRNVRRRRVLRTHLR